MGVDIMKLKWRQVFIIVVLSMNSFLYAQTGSILYEYWSGISGTTVSSLTSNTNYPSSPSTTGYLTGNLEITSNWSDNYGTRIRGFIHPPISGAYRFWIAGDDAAELWLSTDDKQSRKVKIAYTSSYTSPREWGKYPEQQSLLGKFQDIVNTLRIPRCVMTS